MASLEVRYILSGHHQIAYGIVGDGPVDLMFVGSGFIPFTMYRDYPPFASVLDRLGSFARLILGDRRGVGSSDPITPEEPGTPEEIAGDLASILVASGSKGAAIVAEGISVPAVAHLATRFPKLVTHLVLINGFAKQARSEDYPYGFDPDAAAGVTKQILDGSDNSSFMKMLNPDVPEDDVFHRFAERGGSLGASRSSAEAILSSFGAVDIRDVLPLVKVPTLVMHRRNAQLLTFDQGIDLADRIEGATFVELEGANQMAYLGETETWLAAVEKFVVGSSVASEAARTMATMLFTDVVGSTELAADVGDRRWRELLDRLDGVSREGIEAHGGRRITTTGDGVLAVFPMPTAAVAAATDIIRSLESVGLAIRASIHTGEVEQRGSDIGGIAVNLTARILDLAGPGEILVSGAVPAITIGSSIEYTSRGVHELRGVPGRWPVLAATLE